MRMPALRVGRTIECMDELIRVLRAYGVAYYIGTHYWGSESRNRIKSKTTARDHSSSSQHGLEVAFTSSRP